MTETKKPQGELSFPLRSKTSTPLFTNNNIFTTNELEIYSIFYYLSSKIAFGEAFGRFYADPDEYREIVAENFPISYESG